MRLYLKDSNSVPLEHVDKDKGFEREVNCILLLNVKTKKKRREVIPKISYNQLNLQVNLSRGNKFN